ncbi:MAG: GtrA family protein [Propioniciclava sp.]|uniref:GtrA family protein n=1 Tax=Propioniciclava sp. TaxID=2038686 RepID=UPI0039E23F2F
MSALGNLWGRWGNSVRELVKFGLVGGAGVGVNIVTVALAHNIGFHMFGVQDLDAFIPVPGTDLALRFYIVYAGIAFLVANLFNFLWNRYWTFRHQGARAPFWKEFMPFLTVGAVAQLVGFGILFALRNEHSPFYLSDPFFTDAGAFWTRRLYWAQLIQIVLVMPINFVVNKLWTFRAVRRRHAASIDS